MKVLSLLNMEGSRYVVTHKAASTNNLSKKEPTDNFCCYQSVHPSFLEKEKKKKKKKEKKKKKFIKVKKSKNHL